MRKFSSESLPGLVTGPGCREGWAAGEREPGRTVAERPALSLAIFGRWVGGGGVGGGGRGSRESDILPQVRG